MGVDHCLVCEDCKVFLDLHKWPIVDIKDEVSVRSAKFVPGGSGIISFNINQEDALIAIEQTDFKGYASYVFDLIPRVKAFVEKHDHILKIYVDIGDLPWDYMEDKFYDWRQVLPSIGLCLYLPRNLREDYGLRTWGEVLSFLETRKLEDKYGYQNFHDFKKFIKEGFEKIST
ncbi:hypothetical protein ACFLZN_02630 [Nanoarchaeota archaeon]